MLKVMRTFLNASEVAKLLKVDRATVTRYIKRGEIKGAVRLSNTGRWRIPLESYKNFIKDAESRAKR